MRRDTAWLRWAMGSARSWRDIRSLVPETGIDMVDGDHRILLEFAVGLNLLAEDAGAGFTEELMVHQRQLLQAMIEYTKFHFDREERLIAAIGAPLLERQRTEHARIVESLAERTKDFAAGRLSVSPALRRAVFAWIVDHIAGTDWESFRLANLEGAFRSARDWFDIRGIIRSTGVDRMDVQHRVLAGALLKLSAALREGAGIDRLRPLLDRLLAITRAHFADEEAFMVKFDIDGLADQRTTHAAFLARLDAAAADLNASATRSPDFAAVAHELMVWLADHVNGLDYDAFRRGDWMERAFETHPTEDLLPLVRATGIPQVDADHLEFIRKATSFGDLVTASKSGLPDTALRSFDELAAFAARHFKDEEGRFPAGSASRAQRHFDEHRGIAATLQAYRIRLAEGRVGAAVATRSMILGWWVGHTNGTDIDTLGSLAFDGRVENEA